MRPHTPHIPANVYPWLVWGVAGLFVLYQFLLQVSTSVMDAQLVRDLVLDQSGLGAISSSFYYTYLVLQIPAGLLVGRFGPRTMMTFGLVGSALASLIFAFCQDLHIAEVSRMLMGISAAPAVVSALTLAARWFSPARFAMLAGLTEMLGAVGGAVGQEVLGAVVHKLGWRESMLVCTVVGGLLAFMAWWFVRNNPPVPPPGVSREDSPNLREGLTSLRKLLIDRQVWLNGLICGLTFTVTGAFALLWGVPYLELRLEVDLPAAAFASSLMFWGAVPGLPFFGWLSGKIQRRKLPLALGTAITLLLVLVLLFWPNLNYYWACAICFTIGFAQAAYALGFAVAGDIVPHRSHGPAMGFINMMSLLVSGWLLQPVIGWLLDVQVKGLPEDAFGHALNVDAYRDALLVLPVSLAFALILLCFLKETRCRNHSDDL